DVLREPVFLRAVRQQHYEEFAVPDRHDHVQVGDVVERVAAVVHLVFQVERLGEMRGLDQGGDAALDRDVAAQEVGGALKNPGRVAVEPGLRVLGRHQRDVEL